jgi:transcriptional regulator with XRE-family HTH domain
MQETKTTLTTEAISPSGSDLARNLSRRLRFLRAKNGITQAELSSRMSTDRAYVSRIENAKILPNLFTLARLASCLGVDPAELVRGEAERPANRSQNPDRATVPR